MAYLIHSFFFSLSLPSSRLSVCLSVCPSVSGHEGAITSLSVFSGWSPSSEGSHRDAFSPFALSGSEDRTLRVWSLINPGTCLSVLRGPEFDVLAVSIFFPFRQKELALLEEETTTAAAAAASPLSPRIAAAGGGASSSSHSVGGGGHRSVSALDPSCVVDVDFILIGGGMDDCLHLWSYSPHESHSTQLLQILTPSPQPSCINAVVCLDSQATGPIVIAGTANAEVIVWSLVGPRYSLLAVMTGHSDEIQSLAVHQAEGGYAFAVSGGHYLLIFCLRYIYHICIHIYMICMYRNCSIY